MKVIVGMSGGVDSSVAAYLLKKEGYEVIGVTYKMLEDFDSNDAKEICEDLNIEFHEEDITKEFKKEIIDEFNNNYQNGLTPNPCVSCNKKIKFKYLMKSLEKYNADYIATGHYVKIIDNKLYKSDDLEKDQSYFLYSLDKEILSKLIFPLKDLTKENVRQIALDNNLITANKKDSYDVCFIKNNFKDYIKNNLKNKPGNIVDIENNKILGKHKGLAYYTIGQRKGLNIGGAENRMFVVGKNVKDNILYVTCGDNEYLKSDSCIIKNVNFNCKERPTKCTAKFRYRQIDNDVELEYLDNNEIKVKYNGVKAVTPGQACVLYINSQCIGGGIIKEVCKNNKKI